ncbi:hypothetical protein IG631_23920 [Alternaria alternata]|nr:hypothetical protein IG631_23920 [Alternaria alternata]
MRLVVSSARSNTVPARRKHQLEAKAVRAVCIDERLVRKHVTRQGAFGMAAVVQVSEPSSLFCERFRRLVVRAPQRLRDVWSAHRHIPPVCVAGNHREARGKSRDLLPEEKVVAVAASASAFRLDLPCLHHHPADLRDDLDATVRVGEHQRRCPVSRHVLEDRARGAAGLQ